VDSHPDHLEKHTKEVSNKDVLTLKIAPGGGQVIHIRMVN
jgi:hypothetical protein